MESLYSRLAREWDRLFVPDEEREAFLGELVREELSPDEKIVEVGCGTGATAMHLAGLGYTIDASDLDDAMIAVARGKASTAEPDGRVVFRIADMTEALDSCPPGGVGMVLCLGNTLPHLGGRDDVGRFFDTAARILRSGGHLVIQILNYPGIVSRGAMELPELRTDELVFRRKQEFDPVSGRVVFRTEVQGPDGVERREHSLMPLDPDDLRTTADDSGFDAVRIVADWRGREFLPEDSWLAMDFRLRQTPPASSVQRGGPGYSADNSG